MQKVRCEINIITSWVNSARFNTLVLTQILVFNATKAEELWRSRNESKAIDLFRRALKITCEMSHKLLKVYYFAVSLIT